MKSALHTLDEMANMLEDLTTKKQVMSAIIELGKPSSIYKPKLYLDGNRWRALYGNDIETGVCGFGSTPAEACKNFNLKWIGK